ncbi:unnamed protein product [Meganyctiphanes norvegica]|uniref:Reelin domain-containing protein n=1 Tax=Meganyctiphanes norvegica TaxID=48144 RepID=A0AAV2QS71_MEGNR
MRPCCHANASLIYLCILMLGRSVRTVQGFIYGTNTVSCEDIKPSLGVEPQTDTSPFIIITDAETLDACDRLKVSLVTVNGDDHFKGFIVQARSEDKQEVVGTFSPYPGTVELPLRFVDCDNGTSNTVSYDTPSEKKVVHLEWAPSENYTGDIYFAASFITNITTFWSNVTSEPVSVTNKGEDCPSQDLLEELVDRLDGLEDSPCNSSLCTENRLPGAYCNSTLYCIEGLECRDNKCACPMPCEYVAEISSCDCGTVHSATGAAIIIGILAGAVILAFWYWVIKQTIENFNTSKGRVYNNGNRQRRATMTPIQDIQQYDNYMQNNTNYRIQNNRGPYPQTPTYGYENMNIRNPQQYPNGHNAPYPTNWHPQAYPTATNVPYPTNRHPQAYPTTTNVPYPINQHPQAYPTVQNVSYSANLQRHPNPNFQNHPPYRTPPSVNNPNSYNMGIPPNNLPTDHVGVANTYGASVPIHTSSPPSTASIFTSHSGQSTDAPLSQGIEITPLFRNRAVAPLEPLKPLKPIESKLGNR